MCAVGNGCKCGGAHHPYSRELCAFSTENNAMTERGDRNRSVRGRDKKTIDLQITLPILGGASAHPV